MLRTLGDAGHEAALVGGVVRDRLRGESMRASDDWDAASSARPEEVAALFDDATWENRFGTVTIVGDPTVEITSYRTEGGYRDQRRPDDVRFGASIEQDLARRDFTINAMAWLPTDLESGRGRVIDPHDGARDLEAGVLRTVGRSARTIRRGRSAAGPRRALRRPLRTRGRPRYRGGDPSARSHGGDRLGRACPRRAAADARRHGAFRRTAAARGLGPPAADPARAHRAPGRAAGQGRRRATRSITRWHRSTPHRPATPHSASPRSFTTSARRPRRPTATSSVTIGWVPSWRPRHSIGCGFRPPCPPRRWMPSATTCTHTRTPGPMPPCGASFDAWASHTLRCSSHFAAPTTPPPVPVLPARRTSSSSSAELPSSWRGRPTS